ILGAGASYDSAPYHMLESISSYEEEWRPPLADHLFARSNFQSILARYPYAMGVLPQLTGVKQKPHERILDELQREAPKHPMRHSQLTAIRFYLRDLLTECGAKWT